MKNKTISITCSYDDLCSFSDINAFQKGIKKRNGKQIEHIIDMIILHGFSFPFFVWKQGDQKHCIDGHGRLLALTEMKKRGYTIPELPVVYIEAATEKDARKKIIEINNVNGHFNKDAFLSFVADFAETLDFDSMSIPEMDLSGISAMFNVDIQHSPAVLETPVEKLDGAVQSGDEEITCPYCQHTFHGHFDT